MAGNKSAVLVQFDLTEIFVFVLFQQESCLYAILQQFTDRSRC